MSDSFWKTTVIPKSSKEYLELFKTLEVKVKKTYDQLFNHLETVGIETPSPISIVIDQLHSFDQIVTEADRTLLNLSIYINTIRVNHLASSLSTRHTETLINLLQILAEQRRSLTTIDYTTLLEAYNEQKDKNLEIYMPCLALLERKTFKNLLNGLMNVLMIMNFISKHLENYKILNSINVNIESSDTYHT